MRIRTLEISVGAFMMAGFAGLIFLALKVSGLTLDSASESYKVSASFENIGGLTVRAKVTMAGVEIGRVSDIYLDKENFVGVVNMDIYQQFDNLSIDSTAAILTAGVLGEKYIGIVVGAEDEYLVDGDEIEDTQSALVLEDLISKFLFNKTQED
ncbi:outer membrane lipid asymmetry maintenance protein MlaD [Gammaproteobacteria bacterium 45_16_T64]|nr:outer membrane lipid asymmetry maintenance protein MlaD [Gammaproteobacteria bacterium 45_16_T64]